MKNMIKGCISLFLMLCIITPAAAFGPGAAAEKPTTSVDIPEKAQDLSLTLRVPVLSPLFIETPVAAVNGQPILLGEFARAFAAEQGNDAALAETFARHLDVLIKQRQGDGAAQPVVYAVADSMNRQTMEIRVPIFSPLFAETPVAVVDDEAISFADFTKEIIAMYSGMAEGEVASHDYVGLLNRMIAVRLVVLEAQNIGIDETAGAAAQISNFSDKALAKYLLQEQSKDVVPVKEEVDEAYQLVSQEVRLMTIQVKSQQQGQEFLEAYQQQGGFEVVAQAWAAEGKASLGNDEDYVHIDELLPKVKSDLTQLEIGDVSQIYKASAEGFLIFKLLDRRFAEDLNVYQEIQRRNLEKERQARSFEYIATLEEKYVRYNKDAQSALDFENLMSENPELDLRDYLKRLRKDQRILVTFAGADELQITVAQLAEKINDSFYHGLEETVTAAKLNEEKEKALFNMQFQITSRLEAEKLGLDSSSRYLEEVEQFTTTLLFESFLEKVIAPEVVIAEEEVRQRYSERLSEFSSPTMLKMRSLVFASEEDATVAFNRLKSGSDFKWVSANSRGMVEKSAEDVLPFESNLLSVTALPAAIQEQAATSGAGDVLLFTDPEKYVYVLLVEAAYPPQPKAYEQVRSEVGQALYNEKFQQILDHWVSRLKEAYATEIFLAKN